MRHTCAPKLDAYSSEALLDREQLGEARDLEHALYALGRVPQHEAVTLRFDPLLRLHQEAQAGRVDELEIGEIDHERIAALLGEFDQRAAERRGRPELQVAADRDDGAVFGVLDGDRNHWFECRLVRCHKGSVPNCGRTVQKDPLGRFPP